MATVGDHLELDDKVNDDDVGTGVEVVMMDTVRGAIRASGGIWGGGRRKTMHSFCSYIESRSCALL